MEQDRKEGRRVSVDDVYGELVKIRRTGLSEQSVREHGEKLLTLPIVTDEFENGSHATVDRVNAAVKAVECAVDHLTSRDPDHSYLVHTLVRIKSEKMAERILDAREALGYPVRRDGRANDHVYSQLEADLARAYRRLAAALVRANSSPCVSLDIGREADNAMRSSVQALVSQAEVIRKLIRLHPGLESQARAAVYDALITLWPNGAQILADLGVDEDLRGPTLLAEAIIITINARHSLLNQYMLGGKYVILRTLSPLSMREANVIHEITGESLPDGVHVQEWLDEIAADRGEVELNRFAEDFFAELLELTRGDELTHWPTLPRRASTSEARDSRESKQVWEKR